MIRYDIFVNCNWVITRCQQYSTHLHTNNTQNNTNILGECGPCTVLASYTLAFALQMRKKHGKTSVYSNYSPLCSLLESSKYILCLCIFYLPTEPKYGLQYKEIRKRKANWIGHILRRNHLLKQVIEGKIKADMEVTRRRGRRRRKLLDGLKDRRGYSHLKEEALDRTMWRNRFGGGFGPVVRQNTEWMNE